MTDRFKFRVWDKEFKKYWTNGEIRENAAWLLFPDNDNIENIEIEQCSGIKDRNNKLVYEGDLLRLSIRGYVQDNLLVVEDLRSFFFLLDREDHYYAVSWFEVVGNIHENPELLK